jgi:hypothetical protein
MSLKISSTECRKAIKLFYCDKFTGGHAGWRIFKLRFVSSLQATGYNFSKLLESCTLPADELKDNDKLETQVIAANAVWNHLLRCLGDDDVSLIMHLPNWTSKQAGVTGVTNSSASSSASNAKEQEESKTLMNCPHPSEAWKLLVQKYEPNTTVHVRLINQQLNSLQMEDDFDKYVSTLERLWAQLTAMNEPVSARNRLSHLLNGLPSWATAAVNHIDSDENYTYDAALLYLKKYFARQAAISKQGDTSTALTTAVLKQGGANQRHQSQKKTCAYCRRTGHLEQECWEKNPHLKKYKFRNAKGGPSTYKTCTYCARNGHTEADCHIKARAQQLHKQNERTVNAHQTITEEDGHVLVALPVAEDGITDRKTEFLIDSGAETHVCNNRKYFIEFYELKRPLTLKGYNGAAGSDRLTHGGVIKLDVAVEGKRVTAVIKDVVYAPNARTNLLSTTAFLKKGLYDKSAPPCGDTPGSWTLYKRVEGEKLDQPALQATLVGKRLVLNVMNYSHKPQATEEHVYPVAKVAKPSLLILHNRFGHIGYDRLKQMIAQQKIEMRMTDQDEAAVKSCAVCKAGKLKHQPVPKVSNTRATQVLERIHSDLWGPAPMESRGRNKYLMTFTDDKSRKMDVEFLHAKSEVPIKIKEYITFNAKHKQLPVRFFRSDNAAEYVCNDLKQYYKENGIIPELTVPYTPSQNGVSERANRLLLEPARCMLEQSGLPQNFWAEAVRHACDLHNVTPSKANNGESPYFVWSGGKQPELTSYKTFGCATYVLDRNASKLDSKAITCVYLGREPEHKGHRLYNPIKRTIFCARDVEFNEEIFPLKKQPVVGSSNTEPASPKDATPNTSSSHTTAQDSVSNEQQERLPQLIDSDDETDNIGVPVPVPPDLPAEPELNDLHEEPAEQVPEIKAPVNRSSTRVNKGRPPMHLSEYVAHRVSCEDDPESLHDALASDESKEWKQAADRELAALIKNETWTLVQRPKDKHALKTKWVLRRKYNEDGSIERYKARLVVKGYEQYYGIDYEETFAPVASYKSLRVLLAIAALMNLKLHQLDVVSAFLNGKIDKEIYLEQPEGFSDGTDKVCLLRKSLYGLKQASRIWNSDIHNTLTKLKFKQCRSDPCVYVHRKAEQLIILLLWVDDMVLAYNDDNLCQQVIHDLKEAYELQDRGQLKWILGMSVNNNDNAVSICQEAYINKVLKNTGMTDCHPLSTPAIARDTGSTAQTQKADATNYRSITGMLLHAHNCTRADISFATVQVCRYMNEPTTENMQEAKRILRYLKGCSAAAITFKKKLATDKASIQPIGYSDASWGEDLTTRRSISGYAFFIGTGPVAWNSKLQHTVALSSAEAEYIALSAAVQEATWLTTFINELGFKQEPTKIFVDSQAAKAIAENPVHQARTKHIDIRHHFIRDQVTQGKVNLEWCSTQEQTADIFTKPLKRELFKKHAENLLTYASTLT